MNQINVPGARYGYTGDNGTVLTPNLAKFGKEGVIFTSWYSSFHVCSPSRGSMMTGRYSVRFGIGIPNNQFAPDAPGPSTKGNDVLSAEAIGGLPLNETTSAEALKAAGYRVSSRTRPLFGMGRTINLGRCRFAPWHCSRRGAARRGTLLLPECSRFHIPSAAVVHSLADRHDGQVAPWCQRHVHARGAWLRSVPGCAVQPRHG